MSHVHVHVLRVAKLLYLAPNRRRFHWSISQRILLRRKNIFDKCFKSSLSLFMPSFRFFQHLANTISPFWWAFLTEISPWPRCGLHVENIIHVLSLIYSLLFLLFILWWKYGVYISLVQNYWTINHNWSVNTLKPEQLCKKGLEFYRRLLICF